MRKLAQTRPAVCWLATATLAFLSLASQDCQAQTNTSPGPDWSVRTPITVGEASTSTSDPTPVSSVTLALLGDVMLGRDVHPAPDTFTYLKPFLDSADLTLANLESPLTNSPAETGSLYILCAPPGNAQYLVDAGFDLVALANNHRLDCGAEGLLETQKTLTEAGLGFIGPDAEPVHRSIHGIQLAFLAFDATARFDIETVIRAVKLARKAGAVVIVSMHWGAEYQAGASSDQIQIARQLAEAGASLIWGHHPHVLQPAEWIGDGKTLVFYSLGNAMFDQVGLASTRQSALAVVTLDTQGVERFSVIPFLIDVRNSRVVEAGQTEGQIILQYFK